MVRKGDSSYEFLFMGRKDALSYRVVPAIRFSTHPGLQFFMRADRRSARSQLPISGGKWSRVMLADVGSNFTGIDRTYVIVFVDLFEV
jgi:hypothetical protein